MLCGTRPWEGLPDEQVLLAHMACDLPVHRGRADAGLVLKEAEKRLAEGAAVIFYPEGTATRDPELWPMVAKTGVARLALTSGAPVIPIAHWGTQDILPYGSKKLKLFPRKTVRTVAGKPVDLSEWAGQHTSARALRAATEAIMGSVTALVADLRGEEPPAVAWDPNTSSRTVAGSTPTARPAVAADPVVTPPEAVVAPDTATATPTPTADEATPEVTGQ